ncbi:competence/damage-inducible protein A [Comamonas composti]|uniref:competence/damage-inducible protein A n=1 Tax=Comamonas composti TaxID=408558 RepID=UPI000417BCFE|nr:molybdopterin-binding protein [Comamonas composti]
MKLTVGALIIGDEILSGKRADQHLPKLIELLGARGLSLSFAEYVGDDEQRITDALRRAFSSGQVVFSFGGIGATPDDRTRQCAAEALGVPLDLHPEAVALIRERMRDVAEKESQPYEPQRPDNVHRLQMGNFPVGARIIPNVYNKIPGFSCTGQGGGTVHFMPGFPVMAWPMAEWVLDQRYAAYFHSTQHKEHSVIVYGGMEAALTPLMVAIERDHPGVKVFSLPSVDDDRHGRHIELGVKGEVNAVLKAWPTLLEGLHSFGASLGPEVVRTI